jgi:hypothetical protein
MIYLLSFASFAPLREMRLFSLRILSVQNEEMSYYGGPEPLEMEVFNMRVGIRIRWVRFAILDLVPMLGDQLDPLAAFSYSRTAPRRGAR